MFTRGFALVLFLFGPVAMYAAVATKPDPTPAEIQNIITKFTEKETQFAAARENYTWQQSTKLEEVDPPGGSYYLIEDVGFDDRNRRTSQVTYAPVPTLQNIVMTREDEEDFRNIMPFVMTNSTRDEYIVNYVGRQQVDEIGCYVFAVKPIKLTKDRKRYFDCQIWVDDRDLQIVKTYGQGIGRLGHGEDQQFPKFETYREQIDGKYWFPVYTYADDTLTWKDGQTQRIKVVVRYSHYKKWQFKTNSTIKYGDVQPSQPKGSDKQK
ncbi:MAG: hypothetical protein ACRD4O_16165 [Bryobacteraceae bacterium]